MWQRKAPEAGGACLLCLALTSMSRRFLQRRYDMRGGEENASRYRCEERRILTWKMTLKKMSSQTTHWSTNRRFRSLYPSHSMDNVELVPLELITSNRDAIRKAREAFLISKGKTLEPLGLNRRDEVDIFSFLYISFLVHVEIFLYFCLPIMSLIFPLVSFKIL